MSFTGRSHMATLRKLPSGKFNVQIRREGYPPISDTFETKTDAKAWARGIERDIDHRKHFGLSRIRTVTNAVVRFNGSNASIESIKDRRRHLDWWSANYGASKLIDFGADTITEGIGKLAIENIERRSDRPPRVRTPQTLR